MLKKIPGIIIAGTGSSCGKTTLTCALLKAFSQKGLRARAFKCGPDYIDPMFHREITGALCHNLDPFFLDPEACRALLAENGALGGINVIEGVMGYYDGVGATSSYSTYDIAKYTGFPVILVINARASAASLFAQIHGFKTFKADSNIKGVIFNNCGEGMYKALKEEGEKLFPDLAFLGCLKALPECSLESRHLGLKTALEVSDLREKVSLLGETAAQTVYLDKLLEIAKGAPALSVSPKRPVKREKVKIAVSRDEAFCFLYESGLKALSDMGAKIVYFSPLRDKALPENTDGLYLCGGYPELYADALSNNTGMRESVKKAVISGLPTIAECGGFMYLMKEIDGKSMAGVIDGSCENRGRLSRFGYVTLTAKKDNLLCKKGESVRAHEFHYYDCENPGSDFFAEKPTGKRYECAYATDTLYAGFPHFHFLSDIKLAERFIEACLKEKHKNGRNS